MVEEMGAGAVVGGDGEVRGEGCVCFVSIKTGREGMGVEYEPCWFEDGGLDGRYVRAGWSSCE